MELEIYTWTEGESSIEDGVFEMLENREAIYIYRGREPKVKRINPRNDTGSRSVPETREPQQEGEFIARYYLSMVWAI